MLIDFNQVLLSLDGEELKSSPDKALRLKEACTNALLGIYEDDAKILGEEKLRRYKLASKIYKDKGVIEVTAEEITLIKQLLPRLYGTAVIGPCYEMLEQCSHTTPTIAPASVNGG